MAEPYLRIEAVSKTFDRTVALDDVSLDVSEGEFVFLLGPSGCGKTTLLRIVAGLEEATVGRIIQAGQDVTKLPPAKRNYGIVFQSYALFPNLNVFQNIAYGLQNRREPRERVAARVAEMLALVGLEGYESRYPAQLSGGQQQRVALARALAIAPSLLLLDEPLSALDARVRANLRIEVARLQRQLGITTIMVSHDQEEALTMADRLVVMDRGRVVQVGTPQEIYHMPATPFVADFVGLMNFLPGVVSDGERGHVSVNGAMLALEQPVDQPPGQPVMLAIRPEKVQVDSGVQRPNVLWARVDQVEFMGPFYRLHLRTGPEAHLVAYMPPESAREDTVREGARVPIYLPPHHLRLYPPTGRPARANHSRA